MTTIQVLISTIMIPLIGTFFIVILNRFSNFRETVTLITSILLFAAVYKIFICVIDGDRSEFLVFSITTGLKFAFHVEPLGALFALVASFLWIVNSIYSIGYMRGNNEPRQTQFYAAFAIALSATMGIAYSSNLFTLFVFYEVLTLSTYPLVAHRADSNARIGGRIYLIYLIGASIIFFIPALLWTLILAGHLDFKIGGIISDVASPGTTGILLALFVFGIGKAALMPLHGWLPSAMVAPTPVSALLHAVAVVKAGVFTILKVVIYVIGSDHLLQTGASEWLIYLASFSLIAASVIALTKDNIKARLAYSTVSQLSYIILAAAIATPLALMGAAMHIVTHAFGKITLFFVAGAIHTSAHKTRVSELNGIGYSMPFTMIAFFIGALSIIGLPPLVGVWSKLYIALGSMEGENSWVVAVLIISSLLNVAYLMPIVIRAFFSSASETEITNPISEAPWFCVVPLSLTALICLILFFLPGYFESYLAEFLSHK